jgi:mannose/fructose/N-acetylgalactosamine-specific phosphotransferase system component IIC
MNGNLIPIGVCVVLPIVVVLLNTLKARNETNKKTEVMLKAIESGATIDTDLFKTQLTPAKTIKEKLLARLTAACIVSAIGLSICITTLLLSYIGGVPTQVIQGFIVIGGIILAVGIALFVVYFVGKRMLAKEIEAEEKSLENKAE